MARNEGRSRAARGVAGLLVVLLAGTVLAVAPPTAKATHNYPTPAPLMSAEFEPRWALPGPTPATVTGSIGAVDVVSDTEGNFYLLGSRAVTKLAPSGDTLLNWGTQGSGPGQLTGATDIAIREDEGDTVLYILDAGNCRVQRFTSSGAFLGMFGDCTQAGGEYAYSVASAGDINGDGYDDVIVGAPFFDAGQSDEGRVFVYYGTPQGPATTPAWIAESNQAGARFGSSVASAGDINGDGYYDVIVGAPFFDAGQSDEGRVFAFLGSSSGLTSGAVWTAEADQAAASFGMSISSAGDVNGDGYDDVIAGAPSYDSGQLDEGKAFLWLGDSTGLGPTGIPANADWTAESDQTGAAFGTSVASVRDVDGDGYEDVIVGAPFYDDGQSNEGMAYVYLGSGSGLSTAAIWTAQADQASALMGSSVSSAGDIDADGYDDVLVSAPSFDGPQVDEGLVRLYRGSSSALVASWMAEGDQVGAGFGSSVAPAGDVNGDGYDDVIVGAQGFDAGQTDEGRAFVYFGSAVGLSMAPEWTGESNQAGARFGWSVASSRDLNGDGYSDIVVGARWFDAADTDDGQAFFWLGRASLVGTNGDPTHADAILPAALHPWATSLAVAPATGDVFVGASGLQGGNIYRFSPEGMLKAEWATPTYYQSGRVVALAVDPDGNLWAAIGSGIWYVQASAVRYAPEGVQMGPYWFIGTTGVADMAVDAGGVYFMGYGIDKYTYDGTRVLTFGTPTAGGQTEVIPGEGDVSGGGLAVGSSGEILNGGGNSLRIWTPAGAHVRTILKPDTPFSGFHGKGVLVDETRDTIYVLTPGFYYGSVIRRYDLSGHMKGYWTDRGRYTSSRLPGLNGPMAIDSDGNVYAAIHGRYGGSIVRKISPFGDPMQNFGFMCSWIGPACNGTPGELSGVRGIVVDSNGNVYVTDSNRIKVFSPSGLEVRSWGGTGSAPGQFQFSSGGALEFGQDGSLYVADSGNRRVQVFEPSSGSFLRSWGPLVDPSNPILGTFTPKAIGFRAHPYLGQLIYVADSTRLLKFDLNGRFLGQAVSLANAQILDLTFDAGGDLYMTEYETGRLGRWRALDPSPGEFSVVLNSWVQESVLVGFEGEGYVFLVNLGDATSPELGVKQFLVPDTFLGSQPVGLYEPEISSVFWRVGPLPPGGTAVLKYWFRNGVGRGDGAVMPGTVGYPWEDILADPNPTLIGACLDALNAARAFARTTRVTGLIGAGLAAQQLNYAAVWCSVGSADPNEKGLVTPFARPGEPLLFPIHFENVGDAAAQDVVIDDPLDQDLLVPTLISPGGAYDVSAHRVRWDLRGRNLQPGEGDSVYLVVSTPSDTPSGTVVTNQASIVFDLNPPELTNTVTVIIDGQAPSSVVSPLAETSPPSFEVRWTSEDFDLSGVEHVTLYVSTDGGTFSLFLETAEPEGATEFVGEDGRVYCFVSQAQDRLFNIEPLRGTPDTCTTVIANQPPVADAGLDRVVEATIPGGAFVTLDASGSFDPNGDPLDFSWVLDGNMAATGPNPTLLLPLGTTVVSLLVTDPRGASGADSVTIIVQDTTPPVVNAGEDMVVDEGTTVLFDGAFFDAVSSVLADPTAQIEWDFGEGATIVGSLTADHFYGEDGLFPVSLAVTDDSGNSGMATLTITVNNVAPTALITAPLAGQIVALGTPVTFTGAFEDLGVLDLHTAEWTFVSSSTTFTCEGSVTESAGSGTVAAICTFSASGVYMVRLTVTDDDGGFGESGTVGDVTAFVVVYDPDGGFVTGGGWIDSPPGAYVPNPPLTGKASFGFVSKYQRGSNVPTGQTEFQFKVADLNFHSTSYDWLVVAGAKAQFKGTGTINGGGDYGFLLTAIDGQLQGGGGTDRFRIKIWDRASGLVVYDNQLGADDYGDAATAIDGGSIVIHNG